MKGDYLYNQGTISYPIKEYKRDPSSRSSLQKPSFVIDTTYPRLVQFYHPESPICESFQQIFIEAGRIFRFDGSNEHENNKHHHYHDTITTEASKITFHAVSCAAYMDICTSPEFGIHAVPVLLAFSKGSRKGKVVKRTNDNHLILSHVADMLGVKLHGAITGIVVGENSRLDRDETNNVDSQWLRGSANKIDGHVTSEILDEVDTTHSSDFMVDYSGLEDLGEEEVAAEMMRRDTTKKKNAVVFATHAGNHDQIVLNQNINSLTVEQKHVFEDAATSFLVTMERNIYPPLNATGGRRSEGSEQIGRLLPLSTERADVLKDFLDLCHWALPSSWILHGHINELRNNFSAISKHRQSLRTLLNRLDRPSSSSSNTWKWSVGCLRKANEMKTNSTNEDGIDEAAMLDAEDIDYNYQCGMWKFLHILSIGVVEQHSNVMGDRSRASPSYSAWVMRDFVDLFLIDGEASDFSAKAIAPRTSSSERPYVWCRGCRDGIVKSFDHCLYGLCSRSFNTLSIENKPHNYQRKQISKDWKTVAEWLWQLHNDVQQFVNGELNQRPNVSHDPFVLPWPSKSDCKECYRKVGGSYIIYNLGDKTVQWDFDAVYDHLKSIYWPSGVQNRRIIVLERASFQGRRKRPSQVSSNLPYLWIVPLIFLTRFILLRRFEFRRRLVLFRRRNFCNSQTPFNPYNEQVMKAYKVQDQSQTRQRVSKVKNGLFMHHSFLD